jgi:pentatricopeptide repeat protein
MTVNLHSRPPIERSLARFSLLGILLLGLSVSQGCGVKESTKAHDEGVKASDRGDRDLAIADFSEAIRLDPNYADAYARRGIAYADRHAHGDNAKAIADFSQAIRLDPHDAYSYLFRGDIYAAKAEYDKAIADYSDFIRLNPTNSIDDAGYLNRADAYVAKGDYNKAIADCSQAIRLNPYDDDAYDRRGRQYMTRVTHSHGSKGDFDAAIADYSEAIRINPDSARTYSDRASAYHYKGDYNKAIADYTEAIRLKSDALTYGSLADLYTFCSDVDVRNGKKAVACAKKAFELEKAEWMRPVRLLALADAYAEAGNFDEAMKCVNNFLESNWSKDVSELLRERLSLYEQKKTYHPPKWPPTE